MNMKRILETKLERHLDNETETYMINENYTDFQKLKGLVTNPSITNNGNLHFHSLTKFKRGDLLTIGDDRYLINSDIVRLRGAKHKGIGYYCNFKHLFEIYEDVIIGVDQWGAPVYEKQKIGEWMQYGVLKFNDASNPNQDGIVVPNPNYNLIVKDDPNARTFLTFNKGIKIEGLDFNVFNVAYDKEGIMDISLRFGTGQ